MEPLFVPQEAGVTNALGAVIGDIRAEVIIHIKANYEMNSEEETKGLLRLWCEGRRFSEAYAEGTCLYERSRRNCCRKKHWNRVL